MEHFAAYPAPAYANRRPARTTAAVVLPTDSVIDLEPQGLGLVRGMLAGLAMEVATGVCLYAAWLGWHLLK